MASLGAVSCTTGVASDGTSTPEMTTLDDDIRVLWFHGRVGIEVHQELEVAPLLAHDLDRLGLFGRRRPGHPGQGPSARARRGRSRRGPAQHGAPAVARHHLPHGSRKCSGLSSTPWSLSWSVKLGVMPVATSRPGLLESSLVL